MRLQQLSQIMVQFNPLDPKCTSAREFLRRCVAPAARKSNPECELFYRMRTDRQPPVVHVTYSNGSLASPFFQRQHPSSLFPRALLKL
jgi:hypothetical protein